MAHYQNTYGAVPQTDEYGNPIRPTDEFGRPAQHTTGTTTDPYGTGLQGHQKEHHGVSGMLHRSGSSSSSSSEDDGHGGRRKKGLKEKVKEKMPGSHGTDQPQATSTTTPGAAPGHHEKKGVMDKIKDKLPGSHH